MKRSITLALLAGAVALGGHWVWRGAGSSGAGPVAAAAPAKGDPIMTDIATPASFTPTEAMGETAFNAVCASRHGAQGGGRLGMGPPLMHPIYRPGHHGGMAFLSAVQNGVRAHHWSFGDMPAQKGLTRADVASIVAHRAVPAGDLLGRKAHADRAVQHRRFVPPDIEKGHRASVHLGRRVCRKRHAPAIAV